MTPPRSSTMGTTLPQMRMLLLLLLPFLLVTPSRADEEEETLSPPPPTWHRYVRGPADPVLYPQAVVSVTGDVDNAEALVGGRGGGDGTTTYLRRRASSSETPGVVLDFGQNVVGWLVIEFVSSRTLEGCDDVDDDDDDDDDDPGEDGGGGANGPRTATTTETFPGLRLVFSETLAFLGNRSDFTRSDNAPDAASRLVPAGSDQVAVRPGRYTWVDEGGCEFAGPPRRQVCADGLHGFRYVKVELAALAEDAPRTTAYGVVGIASIGLRWSAFRGTPATYAGHFECADAAVTRAFYDAAYTAEMGLDVFRARDAEPRRAAGSPFLRGRPVLHDGAKRDRDPYVGDLAVSALTAYLTHPDAGAEAARNVLEDLARHQRADGWIPPASINDYSLPLFDYPLWWVACSWDHVFYTGNLSYLETHYGALRAVLDVFYHGRHRALGDDGATPLLLLARPAGYGDFAFVARHGVVAYDNALYVLALWRAADLADLVNRTGDGRRWRRRAAAVSRQFGAVLWDAEAGAFRDRRCEDNDDDDDDDKGCDAHAQDGNSLAVLAGIAPAGSARADAILKYLGGPAMRRAWGHAFYDPGGEALAGGAGFSQRVYPFVSYFEMAARFETGSGAGGSAAAVDQLRRTYGWMAARDPGGTVWEGIGAHGRPYQGGYTSMAHGWSSGAVPLAARYLLGATPTRPGFAAWRVAPRPGGLRWARGAVPTPHGPLRVRWAYADPDDDDDDDEAGGGGFFELEVAAPPGTQGVVAAPDLPGPAWRLVSVRLDGAVVYPVDGETSPSSSPPGPGGAATAIEVQDEEDGGVGVVRVDGGGTLVVRCSMFSSSRWDGL